MSTKRPHRQRNGTSDTSRLVAEYGGRLAAAGDALEAESLAAALLALPLREGLGAGMAEVFAGGLIETAGDLPSPESAALLRALAAVAPARQRREAVAALGNVTAAGHYPPEWAAQIGRAVPKEAWRRYDVFGDTETVVVTFGYGETEHGILLHIDRCRDPVVLTGMLASDTSGLRAYLDEAEPLVQMEPIPLAEARSRIEPALARGPATMTDERLNDATLLALPVARARMRRLPAGDGPAQPHYDATDRSAAVAEFLASPEAAEAGDDKTVRFWAEVLTGYSASVTGEPPARVGPLKLTEVLLSYVPATFALTAEQRHGLPAAVTAWSRWAAGRQGLDEPAQARLAEHLPDVLARFDASYDAEDVALVRGYLADVSAATTDAAALAEALTRRALAVPPPEERGEPDTAGLDATDPAHRRTIVESEFGECEPPEGMDREQFLAAVLEVCEQLWHDDPPQRWQRARELIDSGVHHHEVMHRLAAAVTAS